MNPYDEQRLRDEVIYLHSLWRQGPPPPPSPPPQPNPIHLPIQTPKYTIPYSYSQSYIPQPLGAHFHSYNYPQHLRLQQRTTNPFAPAHTRSLPPTNTSTAFKKRKNHNNNNNNNQNQKKTKKKKKKKQKQKRITREPANNNVTQADPDPPRNPGPEWPCPVLTHPTEKCWPKPRSDPPPKVVSPQEKERLVALQAQRKACHAFREFFYGSDDDDDDDDDGDDDEDDGLEGFEEFFVEIFMEDHDMRRYYQRCYESGEFCCFVCGAIGKKKSGKKFKDCVGLVQHSMAISRTVKKRAHRAFGHVVCKVLGWDIDRLPTIVMKGEPLGCPMQMKPDEEEVM